MEADAKALDPRIRRTRLLLHRALESLLKNKAFDDISVQDIADAATVNRVTFYDHYPDKFALLQCVVGGSFQELLQARQIKFDNTCSSALTALVLSVCDFLSQTVGVSGDGAKRVEPYLESAIIGVVRALLLEGFERHPPAFPAPVETTATVVSWAIYGAAQEWARTPDRPPADEIAGTIAALVAPMLEALHERGRAAPEMR